MRLCVCAGAPYHQAHGCFQTFIVEHSKQQYVINERDLLRDVNTPFVIGLEATFHDDRWAFLYKIGSTTGCANYKVFKTLDALN